MKIKCVFPLVKLAGRLVSLGLLCKGLITLVSVPHFHKRVNKLVGFVLLLNSDVTIVCRSHFSVQVLQFEVGVCATWFVFVHITKRSLRHFLKNSRIVDKSCQLMFLPHVPRAGSDSQNASSVADCKLRMVRPTNATLCV